MEDSLRYLGVPPAASPGQKKTAEPSIEVPSVVNLPLAEARKTLEGKGLPYRVEGQGSIIIDQTPPPGSMVAPGTRVVIVQGEARPAPGLVTVPNLVGQTMRQAAETLAEIGLTLKPVGSGLAVRQDPSPRRQVPAGSLVVVEFQAPQAAPSGAPDARPGPR
ncbi:MAG TPA: PASTA domain-containing protein, partial [Firmicutes bacterium]|nr:PASTA domain-containing protein [Bacillota bacterium]